MPKREGREEKEKIVPAIEAGREVGGKLGTLMKRLVLEPCVPGLNYELLCNIFQSDAVKKNFFKEALS